MGISYKKQAIDTEVLQNPRLHNNIVRRKILEGIDSHQYILNLWLKLINYDFFINLEQKNLKYQYEYLTKQPSQFLEAIRKDIPRTFPLQQNLHSPQNKRALQRVLTALSNRFPEIGYISGMSFYVQRVLQIAPQQKAYHILVWLYLNDSMIYNITQTKESIQVFMEVVNQIVEKECPKPSAFLKHINICVGMFSVAWLKSLFSLICDLDTFCTIFTLGLLEGSKTWIFAIVSFIKCIEKQIMKSNRNEEKVLEIAYSRNLLTTPQTKNTFFYELEKIMQKYKKANDNQL